jgi:hypothetical protein
VLDLLADANPQRADATWLSCPTLGREFEDRLRTEIDQLATRFWNVPPADRLSQWNDLSQQSRCWPSLRARLALLEPGLALGTIALKSTAADRAASLVQSIERLFPLDAASRGRSIGEVLGSMLDEPHAWEEAAHRLSRDRPDIALLVPEFMIAVTTLCDHEREEIRRYQAGVRETVEDAEWECQNLGYYLDWLRGDRSTYWLCGIFGGIPLLVLVIAAVVDFVAASAPKQPPLKLNPDDGIVSETRVAPTPSAEKALCMKQFPPPADSGSDSID